MAGAELLGLSAIVVAQPIFDALQRSTYAFPGQGVDGTDLALFAVMLALLPPALMLVIELLAGLISDPLRGLVHLAWIGLLVALFCWQAVTNAELQSGLLRAAIPALGLIGAAIVYLRFEAARLLLRILAFAAPAVVVLFLFTEPISSFTVPNEPKVPKAQIDSRTPVVLVIFDEFPLAALLNEHGQIDDRRYPNFAALARHSDWFGNALTVADATEQAVPAILTGEFPKPNGVATYPDHPRNLFTLFGPSSYRMNISESVATDLCPPDVCLKGSSSLDSRLAFLTRVGGEVAKSAPFGLVARAGGKLESWFPPEPTEAPNNAFCTPPEVICPHQAVQRFISRIRPGTPGSLNVVHVELPHRPWQYTPSGRHYAQTTPGLADSEMWPDSPGYAIQGLQRMMLQLQYTDRLLGRIVAHLRRVGLYERSLFAVIADHGASYVPGHSHRLIAPRAYADDPAIDPVTAGAIVRVPLFVKRPGQRRGATIRRPVRTIDLMPTIADVLGFRIPWPVDGRSLFGPDPNPSRWANTYMSFREDIVRVPPAVVRNGFLSAAAVRNSLFGHGNEFTFGATKRELRRELHGARRLDVDLDNPGGTTYDPQAAYDPDIGAVPSLLYGRILDPPAEVPERLIATVNGRIVAVALSTDGGTGFTTVIPPSAFHPGANSFELFAP